MKKNGFTFIELLISFVVLSIVFTGFLGITIQSLSMTRENSKRSTANRHANEAIEIIKSTIETSKSTVTDLFPEGIDTVEFCIVETDNSPAFFINDEPECLPLIDDVFDRSIALSYTDDTHVAVQANVIVTWTDTKTHEVQLSTIIGL